MISFTSRANRTAPASSIECRHWEGLQRKLITRVDSPVTVSPDGQRIAFIRGSFPGAGESALVAANVDGTGELVLAKRKLPEYFYPLFFTGPSWSPGGELVASSLRSLQDGAHGDVIAVNVKDGTEQKLTRQRWFFISRVEWLSNGSGLLIIASDQASSPDQVWHLSYPGGEARRITNDLKQYRALSVTSDLTKLVTGAGWRLGKCLVYAGGSCQPRATDYVQQ